MQCGGMAEITCRRGWAEVIQVMEDRFKGHVTKLSMHESWHRKEGNHEVSVFGIWKKEAVKCACKDQLKITSRIGMVAANSGGWGPVRLENVLVESLSITQEGGKVLRKRACKQEVKINSRKGWHDAMQTTERERKRSVQRKRKVNACVSWYQAWGVKTDECVCENEVKNMCRQGRGEVMQATENRVKKKEWRRTYLNFSISELRSENE